jgi:CIC family chloride channel protein
VSLSRTWSGSAQLKERGFDLSRGRDKVTAEQQSIVDLLHADFTTAPGASRIDDLRKRLVSDRRSEVHLVDDAGAYLGTLSMHVLIDLIESGISPGARASEHAEPATVTLTPQTSVWDAMTRMQGFVGESIPVLDDGKLVGALSEAEIVSAYLTILARVREEENAAA